MSTQNRTGGGGRNQKKSNVSSGGGGGGGGDTTVASKKSEVSKPDKEKVPPKPTAEQIRIAQITDISSGSEDPEMREKVQTLIEMTQRSEEEVCCALNECDNNLEKAVAFLFESLPVGAFETSSKKKKTRVASTSNDGNGDGEWTETNTNVDNRERPRNRSGMRGGRGGSDSRGWRSREARENERNAADSKGGEGGGWRGRGRGGSRGSYGGRGGRGGRAGPRGMGSRDQGRNYSRQEPQEVDTWDNTIATNAEQMKQDDEWGDWDNEEYVGSLKDSKIFMSSSMQNQTTQGPEASVPPGLENHNMLNQPSQLSADDLVQQYNSTVASNAPTAPSGAVVNSVQYPDMHTNNNLRLSMESQQMNATSTLSAEQSQYFNSLPSQNASQQPSYNAYQTSSPSSYVSNTVFGDQVVSSQPAVRRARAKVPPPSKIPASAVEMPSDTLNNIGYLDVQFGGLDFGTEDSFDRLTEKFNATSIDSQQNVQSQDISNDYQSKSNVQNSSLTSGLQTSQIISNSDTLSSSQNDNLTSGYSQRGVTSSNVQQSASNVGVTMNNNANNALDQLSKSDPYNPSNSSSNANVYQSTYNSNSTTNKTPSYQSTGGGQGYNSTNYTNSQAAASSTYQPSTNNYNAYNQNSVNAYQAQSQTSVNSSTNSVSGVSGGAISNSSSAQNIPVGAGAGGAGANNSTVNSASSNTNAGYLSSQYQSNQTTSAFPSQQSAYQNSQSVYGNTGVSSVTSGSTASSTVSSVANSTTSANNLSSPSLGLTNTKVTNSTAKSSAGIVPNVQMVSQFIQTGLPYFQQPVYSYEDIQMMQQRMPHVTQYYDLNYPPTSLGASGVRDANLSVAYSTMTDGRFARTDNNSSPVSNVSSTLSQQAGSSGAMLNVPYAYFYNANMMPGSFQYGTPAIYPQQMPTANATSGGQFPKPSYNSAYGSTSYDALNQATKDYNKGYIEYPASGVNQQTKGQNVSNPPQASSGSDITSSMYGKSHVALNKVNSYEKQSFHSGTPPPFNLTGTQTAGATSAQPYGVYIQPMPPTHHQMNLHQPIHQDSNSTGQRPQPNSQSKTGTKQGYSPSYWTAQN